MGGARTGTGKTAGFTLPLLALLRKHAQGKGQRPIRALVLTPTRELAPRWVRVSKPTADTCRSSPLSF
jgi:superfamily II DNA/RNA helicase